MIILGPLFPEEREQEIISASKRGVSNAANNFQWNLIRGIQTNTDEELVVINALPVGTWPKNFKVFRLKDIDWFCNGITGHEIGCYNIPLVKQFMRMRKARALLKKYPDEKEILIFTAYLPFLWAVSKIDPEYKVTAVITDIPEFYDMHRVSTVRKILRKIHCKIVYHFMVRVNRFVLLTEQMTEPLHVCGRPYIVMEGVCGNVIPEMSDLKRSSFSLLYTGRLNRRYGLEYLLNAMKKLDDPDIELWLCGSGEMEEEIKAYAKVDSRIKFFGFLPHDKTLSLQRQATVLVNPRTNEGEYTKYSFPSKTMEYMVSGRPVMMFKLDGVPREYDQYLTYIPAENVEAICQTVQFLKKLKPYELDELGSKGRDFVLKNKNRDVQMKKILDFMDEE